MYSNNPGFGARLTRELLYNVFSWISPKMIQKGVRLRAKDHRTKPTPPTLPSRGLFLSFLQNFGFARVRLGSGTEFDLIPAEVVSSNPKDMYALAVAGGGEWVIFKIMENKLELTEKMKDGCLFMQSFQKKKPPTWLKIVVKNAQDKEFLLKMEGKSIKEYDEDAESSEVSFVDNPLGERDLVS
jgi:hypothetical protein